MGMHNLNSHFLRPSPIRSRDVSDDGQSALVVKLGVSRSRSRLPGPYRYHPGIVQQAQGHSSETAVSPHYNNQSTVYCWVVYRIICACSKLTSSYYVGYIHKFPKEASDLYTLGTCFRLLLMNGIHVTFIDALAHKCMKKGTIIWTVWQKLRQICNFIRICLSIMERNEKSTNVILISMFTLCNEEIFSITLRRSTRRCKHTSH
jgi:hypothetical protein